MPSFRRRTQRLPGDLLVTILRLHGPLTTAVLRAMLASSDWYVLIGHTSSPTGISTGFGAYVGTSDALRAQVVRAGVSLRTWTYRLGRLTPTDVVLIRRVGRPVDDNPRLLVEAAIARAISGAGYTVLNTRTGAPTAARRATRRQRLWALHVSDRLADLVLGRVFAGQTPAATGGSTREQLVRLILAQDPPRAMDVNDILKAAGGAGIAIAGRFPQQRTRRDTTTRELDSGRPRLHRTWVRRRTVIYPPSMTLHQARASYTATHPAPARTGGTRKPANRRN